MSNSFFITKSILRKSQLMNDPSPVLMRHKKLNKLYKEFPDKAIVIDKAEISGRDLHDPFRTTVIINEHLKIPFRVGVHSAVGGDHDHPNPGDLLCATLASCVESTLRMIANRYNITLTKTRVSVSAIVDVRGTLRIDPSVPVGFQAMEIEMEVGAEGLNKKIISTLINGVKKSCIIYQTLKKALPIKFNAII